MRSLTFITVLMLIYLALVQQAKAVDWVHMNTNVSQDKLYFDLDNVKVHPDQQIEVWYKLQLKKPKTINKKKYDMLISKAYVDCSSISIGLLRNLFYYKDNLVLDHYVLIKDYQMEQIIPASFYYDPVATLCMATQTQEY